MASLERLQEAIHLLAVERQALRARDADRDELEPNRLELVRCKQELSRALIARCLRRPDRDAA